ncbi:MAG: hypothetical protein EZS28_020757 [Streblomastix strix]|uniref:Uncharacterized protein n=1 Tax=Streblomastix strix TaxID=222440 RepID=A0A5J4VMQ5_9EUKA|nr:MAG: hypothetical protein EZS28_020757 [Streblomastix strix]
MPIDEDDDDNQQINKQNRNLAENGAQNADANKNALPDWLNVPMGRPRDTPNAIRAQQHHEAITKLFEYYYGRKASDLNPTNKRAIKRERKLLFQQDDEMLGFELNKEGVYLSTSDDDAEKDVKTAQLAVLIQRTCVADSTAPIQGDFPTTQRFIHTCHHVARVIAGDASQSRDVKLVTGQFKPQIGKKGSVLNAFSKQSKDKIKELSTSIKLIASKSPINQKKQSIPPQQQLLITAVLVISEFVPLSIITSQLISTVLQPISNDDAIATICILINISTLLSTYAISRPNAIITTIVFQPQW